ncbi:hypothetical protein BD560DRAFT_341899, partial [Blakeslea trispora]
TDMDYVINCVFTDESGFNINTKTYYDINTCGHDFNSENSQNKSNIFYYHKVNVTLECN